MTKSSFLKSYGFSLVLIAAIIIGSLIGAVMKEQAAVLKPFGDVFINLLFTIVAPLVFFSISSAVAQMTDMTRLGKIIGWMVVIFVVTGVLAALVMIVGVKLYPPTEGMLSVDLGQTVNVEKISAADQIVRTLTVPDFTELFSRKNIFALILFAFLIGLATSAAGAKLILA